MSVAGPWFLSELAAGCVGLLLLLSPLAILIARRRHGSGLIYGACALASCALALVALLALLSPSPPAAIELAVGLPLGRTILGYDPLGAAFALIINVATALVSGYAIGYGAHAREPQRVVPFYPAFIAGMNLVLLSRDAFSFLVGWEFMSLASWALVASDHASAENRRAALVYLIMATAGALTLLFAFGLLAGPAGGYGFAEMRHAAHVAAAPLVLVLALIGAGSKAGLVPLHAWLPLAHPAAPSHVSALMSGVMTKVAVYGFIRIVFDLAGPPSWWWSLPVLVVAGITTLLGVLYALMEHDLKRLLAYHTVENIGIIFIGLGLALAFEASGLKAAAALSLTAAIFHVFNHSLFKSLLFLGSGAVLHGTGRGAGDRRLVAGSDVATGAALPPGGCLAGPRDGRAGARHEVAARRASRRAVERALAAHRPDRFGAQRLRRRPRARHDRDRGRGHRAHRAALRLARPATRSRVGLRLSGCESRHAVHRRELRAAHPARIRRRRVSRPRAPRHARTGRYRTGASRGRAARHALGGALRAGDPPRRCGERPSEPVAAPHHPA